MSWKDYIKELVKKSGSASWLAKQLGCHRSAVSYWQKGRSVPHVKFWNDLVTLSHAAGMKYVNLKYLTGLL